VLCVQSLPVSQEAVGGEEISSKITSGAARCQFDGIILLYILSNNNNDMLRVVAV